MSRPQTPPHEPRYNVHVAPKTIELLFESAFPGVSLLSVSELETDKGYNNRLYFLKVRRNGESSIFRDTDVTEQELVLKVNGRFFLADKVQNEVGCIQILSQYCKDIPTPTVLAWSEDGAHVVLASPLGQEKKNVPLAIGTEDKTHGGWILMSRLPGRPLSSCNFDQAIRLDIMLQLAAVTASWRKNIPAQKYIGNIQFYNQGHNAAPDFVITENSGPDEQKLIVRGVHMDELRITTPICSEAQKYALKMEKKLADLENLDNYRSNRHLAPALRKFVTEELPQLDIETSSAHQSSPRYVFTHYDLSPRNILIEGSPPRICGIVDFEFAGFFSETEEFLNDAVGNDGDWPEELYTAYLEELEKKGVATPAAGIKKSVWDTLHCLESVADNIAPWWLPGPHEGAALEEHFAKSERDLIVGLDKLKSMK